MNDKSYEVSVPETTVVGSGGVFGGPPRPVFVGHRFDEATIDGFRRAVEQALESHKAPLVAQYGDTKLQMGQIFKDKMQPMIDKAFLCIFDITAQERPNVFIELGYAMGKGKLVVITSRVAPPADLAGYDHIRYSSYEDLCEKLKKYLPEIVSDGIKGKHTCVGEIPKEVLDHVYQRSKDDGASRIEELYRWFGSPAEAKLSIQAFVKAGILKDEDGDISLTSKGMAVMSEST